MPAVLAVAANAYRAKLTDLLESWRGSEPGSRPDDSLAWLFPDLTQPPEEQFIALVEGLHRLVPALTDFVADHDHLIADRALAASALVYLIMPFDIVADDHGLAGLIDDAVVAFRLAGSVSAPSAGVAGLVAEYETILEAVQDVLPEWLIEAVEQNVAGSLAQAKAVA